MEGAWKRVDEGGSDKERGERGDNEGDASDGRVSGLVCFVVVLHIFMYTLTVHVLSLHVQ